MASGDIAAPSDTTPQFLRSFSIIDDTAGDSSDSDSDFDVLSPIPEHPNEDNGFQIADSIDECKYT